MIIVIIIFCSFITISFCFMGLNQDIEYKKIDSMIINYFDDNTKKLSNYTHGCFIVIYNFQT